jgi:hypothetical protein
MRHLVFQATIEKKVHIFIKEFIIFFKYERQFETDKQTHFFYLY